MNVKEPSNSQKVIEQDQEMPHSHIADQPMALFYRIKCVLYMYANWGEQTQILYKPKNNVPPLSIDVRHFLLPTLHH